MLPMVGVPETIREGLRPYRDLFRRAEGFEHVSRYVSGLIVSPNKTLQGIYANQVWEEDKPTRRTMHEAVFEAGWKAEELLPRHRALIAPEHRQRGREVISLDWTLVHHERGPHITYIWYRQELSLRGPVSDGRDGRDCQSSTD